jgi:hypothetical protein
MAYPIPPLYTKIHLGSIFSFERMSCSHHERDLRAQGVDDRAREKTDNREAGVEGWVGFGNERGATGSLTAGSHTIDGVKHP